MSKRTQIRKGARPHLYIKEWMDHLGVSDDQLAGRLGVASRTTVWKRYTEQQRLDLGKIQDIAEALGVSVHQLNFAPGTPSLDALVENATADQRAMAADVLRRLLGKASQLRLTKQAAEVRSRQYMTACPWEKIDRFTSPGGLRRFESWIADQIAAGVAAELVAPANERMIVGERWFEHLASGSLWRLVPADGPLAPGFWPIAEERK